MSRASERRRRRNRQKVSQATVLNYVRNNGKVKKPQTHNNKQFVNLGKAIVEAARENRGKASKQNPVRDIRLIISVEDPSDYNNHGNSRKQRRHQNEQWISPTRPASKTNSYNKGGRTVRGKNPPQQWRRQERRVEKTDMSGFFPDRSKPIWPQLFRYLRGQYEEWLEKTKPDWWVHRGEFTKWLEEEREKTRREKEKAEARKKREEEVEQFKKDLAARVRGEETTENAGDENSKATTTRETK